MMDWEILRKTLTPDIGWTNFLVSTLGILAFGVIGILLVAVIFYGLLWILTQIIASSMIGAIVIFVISAYVILYVIALEPLIGRYKRLKRIQGFKQ